MIARFCGECGTQLHNLFSGIVIIRKDNNNRTVCAKCAERLVRDEGYTEQARAKGLAPLAT
jgi:hypothetical protein